MLIDQEVGRLDVAVEDALLVGVVERIGGLDADPRDDAPAVLARGRRLASPFLQQDVESLALDVLHHVEGEPLVVADSVNGNDVGMVQPSDRLRLALEASQPSGVEIDMVDDLEGDVAPERFLERLVHDAHAAASQLADDAEFAEAQREHAGRLGSVGDERLLAELFDHGDGRQQLADPFCILGIACLIFADRGGFAAPTPLGELFGDAIERIAVAVEHVGSRVGGGGICTRVAHGTPPSKPGICSSTSRRRSMART